MTSLGDVPWWRRVAASLRRLGPGGGGDDPTARDPPRLGLWLPPLHPGRHDMGELLAENLEKALLAERLGFDELWVGEHVSASTQPIPAPLAFLAALVPRTRRLRLGTAAINLPLHHPVLVAAEAAQLDQMSGGRLELGVGPGALASDGEIFGVGGDDATRRRMVVEAASLVERLWTLDPPYDLPGEFWRIRATDWVFPALGIGRLPRPRQRPGPPISLTVAGHASPTARAAASHGWGMLSGNTVPAATLASHWYVYAEACRERGVRADPSRWRVARLVLVAPTDAEAERRALAAEGAQRGFFTYLHDAQTAYGVPRPPDPETMLRELAIHGSPATVVDRLAELRREVGPFGTLLLTGLDWSGPNAGWERESMALLAREVLPALRRRIAGEDATAVRGAPARVESLASPPLAAPVLLVSHDLTLTGAPRVLVQLGKLLRRVGVDVHLATFQDGEDPAMTAACAAAGIVRVPLADPAARGELARRYAAVVANTVVVEPWLRELVRPARDGAVDEAIARRVVWWIHEVHPRYLRPETAALFADVGAVAFDSANGRERWREELGLGAAATHVCHPAVSAELAIAADLALAARVNANPERRELGLRARARRDLGVFPDDLVVLSLSSLIPEKGVRGIVAAFERLLASGGAGGAPVKAHLLIAGGDGEPESRRVEEAASAVAAASSYGTVFLRSATADTAPYFAAADVFVSNTQPPGEMFGVATIEAMAFGLPILAPDRGGATEIVVPGETGLLHDPTDPTTLATNLATLYHDRPLAHHLGTAGRHRAAELFTETTMWERWRRLLTEVAGGRDGAAVGSSKRRHGSCQT